jgi:hypothetical protein
MTLNSKSLRKRALKRKTAASRNKDRMTAEEEKAVAGAYHEIKEGKVRTFKNADEYLRYPDTV